jgi:hypothetical protein
VRYIVALLVLLPLIAFADETVETKDGRRLLLRDNGTYQVVPAQGLRCKNEDQYKVVGYHDRGDIPYLTELYSNWTRICVTDDMKVTPDDQLKSAFYYLPRGKEVDRLDGYISFCQLGSAAFKYIHDNCTQNYCQVVAYGFIHRLDRDGGILINAEKMEW